MTLITVLIVLAAEFYFHLNAEHRNLNWFQKIQTRIDEALGDKPFYEGWGGVLIVLLVPLLILWLVINLVTDELFHSVLFFLVSCIVLWFSMGPKPLIKSFAAYFEATERGDNEAAYLVLQEESNNPEVPEGEDIIRNATRRILVESQQRYFGVLFWFIFLGPFGALFYRIAHEYYDYCVRDANEEHEERLYQLLHWLDCFPARLTSILFLLTGDFVNGFSRVKDYFVDFSANNKQLLSETGIAALGIAAGSASVGIQENKNAIAMVERTVILYVVAVAALSPLAFL